MANILVVDDIPGITRLVETILVNHGHRVSKASRRQEFLCLVENEKLDLLIVDLRMNDMNGIECSEIGQKYHPKIGIIAMTGSPDLTVSETEWLKKVPYRVVFKPFDSKDLEEAVDSYLKLHGRSEES